MYKDQDQDHDQDQNDNEDGDGTWRNIGFIKCSCSSQFES